MINLLNSELFKGFNNEDLNKFLKYMNGIEINYKKNNIIYDAGNVIDDKFGIILNGSVNVVNITSKGEENLMFNLVAGEMFCESACFTDTKKLPFSIIANENTKVLFVNCKKLFNSDIYSYKFYPLLMQNFISILAKNNVLKAQKMDILSRRSIQDKVVTYLSMQKKLHNSNSFFIPFNREQLATYLAVDRSALSNVLSSMQKNNLISFHKNYFVLNF